MLGIFFQSHIIAESSSNLILSKKLRTNTSMSFFNSAFLCLCTVNIGCVCVYSVYITVQPSSALHKRRRAEKRPHKVNPCKANPVLHSRWWATSQAFPCQHSIYAFLPHILGPSNQYWSSFHSLVLRKHNT